MVNSRVIRKGKIRMVFVFRWGDAHIISELWIAFGEFYAVSKVFFTRGGNTDRVTCPPAVKAIIHMEFSFVACRERNCSYKGKILSGESWCTTFPLSSQYRKSQPATVLRR